MERIYRYRNCYEVVTTIECLIIAYRTRGEMEVVKGLQMALEHIKSFKGVDEITI